MNQFVYVLSTGGHRTVVTAETKLSTNEVFDAALKQWMSREGNYELGLICELVEISDETQTDDGYDAFYIDTVSHLKRNGLYEERVRA